MLLNVKDAEVSSGHQYKKNLELCLNKTKQKSFMKDFQYNKLLEETIKSRFYKMEKK